VSTGRLVLDGGDPDAVRTPSMARVLARSGARALRRGRGVVAYGPVGDAAADPAPCGCHATARAWTSAKVGRWVLPASHEGLPATPLLSTELAAAAVAAFAVGAPLPAEIRYGLPLGLSWRVWAPPPALEPPRRTAVNEGDLVAAAAVLEAGMHLELTGPYPASAVVFLDDDSGAGWALELLRVQGQVAREMRATTRDELLAAIRGAAAWVMGSDTYEAT